MDKTKQVDAEAPGAESMMTVDQVQRWLTRDLGAVIAMLEAIRNDPNLLRAMATHMKGVHDNTIAHNAGIREVIGKGPLVVN